MLFRERSSRRTDPTELSMAQIVVITARTVDLGQLADAALYEHPVS